MLCLCRYFLASGRVKRGLQERAAGLMHVCNIQDMEEHARRFRTAPVAWHKLDEGRYVTSATGEAAIHHRRRPLDGHDLKPAQCAA